jgi:uncharacterized protein
MSKRNIVHIEIPAQDSKKSGKFYEDLFGWKITTLPEMNYTMWDPAAQPGGGFSDIGPDTAPGDVLIYVDSEDIEADLKRVEELGGMIVTNKTEIPGVGWFGVFKDLAGNKIALYTSRDPDYNK